MSELQVGTPVPATATTSTRRRAPLVRLLTNPLGAFSALVLLAVAVGTVFAPALATHDLLDSTLRDAFAPPGGEYLLGADSAGRDVWTRLLYGARNTLGGALLALAVAMVLGIPGGLLAGYLGRTFDTLASWVVDLVMSLPAMIVLLAARAVLGPTVWALMIILGVLAAPSFYRLVRGIVMNVRRELYVDAARVSGLPGWRIVGRHVLVVVRAPIIIQISLVAGVALGLQAGLEFIGVGSSTAVPTWGSMLDEGFQNLTRSSTLILWPALALGLTSAAFVLFAVALRDVLESRGEPTAARRRNLPPYQPGSGVVDEQALLSIRSLAIAYPGPDGAEREVVQDVDLDVQVGEIVGLVGESGSGKTQSAFAALGVLPAAGRVVRGTICIDGTDVLGLRPREWRRLRSTTVAYVPQEPMSNLDPSFTIGAQLVEAIRAGSPRSRSQARSHALDLLAQVEIADPERTFAAYPHEISGGMAQRVLIAIAMSCDPKLLIADEPTTALDVTVQAEVLGLLRRLQRDRGLGVLLVTHNFGVVADLCDRVTVMQQGRTVESGPVQQVLTDPAEPYTRRLLAAMLEDVPLPAGIETEAHR